MEARSKFFDKLSSDELVSVGKHLTTRNPPPRLLFQPSVLTRAVRKICPKFSASLKWVPERALLKSEINEGVSISQSFLNADGNAENAVSEYGFCTMKVFMELVCASEQKVTKLLLRNDESLSFYLEHVGTGPLSLSFADYRIKKVILDYRLDYVPIIRANGSSLEEIDYKLFFSVGVPIPQSIQRLYLRQSGHIAPIFVACLYITRWLPRTIT